MEQERWKDIEGYDGLYQISDYGRIKSFNGGWGKRKTGKLLSLSKSNNGYYSVGLHLSGIGKTIHISRLVAKYFISNPENKPEVNHIDGIKINNHYTNLEWATASENRIHAYKVLHKKAPSGENHCRTRLTNEKVKKIRESYKTKNYTYNQLAQKYDTGYGSIYHILGGRTWKHIL
jgi:hypothetical protein